MTKKKKRRQPTDQELEEQGGTIEIDSFEKGNLVIRGCCSRPDAHPFVLIQVGKLCVAVETARAIELGWQLIAAATESTNDSATICLMKNKTNMDDDDVAGMLHDLTVLRKQLRQGLNWKGTNGAPVPEVDQEDGPEVGSPDEPEIQVDG